jgi:peptide-methionine (S)-S-oxide reductase
MLRQLLILTLLSGAALPLRAEPASAMFAGGCFWCMESASQEREGIIDVVSGFTGGTLPNPVYAGDHRGHFEAIRVTYDPEVVSYQALLDLFWVNIDPFDDGGQFCDRGFSYRSALFPATAEERALAEQSKAVVQQRFPEQTVYTEIRTAGTFWPVEEYHQDYYRKNPLRYKYYRWNCGRDQRLEVIWGPGPKN